jgi:hypothetical protein
MQAKRGVLYPIAPSLASSGSLVEDQFVLPFARFCCTILIGVETEALDDV